MVGGVVAAVLVPEMDAYPTLKVQCVIFALIYDFHIGKSVTYCPEIHFKKRIIAVQLK